jgi:hypothetical protein
MKILLRIVLALFVLAILLVACLFLFIDPIVRGAIEKGTTYATGVETKIDSVDAGFTSGKLSFAGLSIANPPGFRPEPFLRIGHAGSVWQNSTLFSDTIVIDELKLDGLDVNLERADGHTNFGRILDNVGKLSSGAEKPAEPKAGAGSSHTLIVKHILLTNVKCAVHWTGSPLAADSMGVTVPKIELSDFRSDGSTSEIVGKLTKTIVDAVLSSSLEKGQGIWPADLTKDLSGNLATLQAQAKDLLKGAGKSFEDAGKALEGVKDIFKKK